MAQTVIRPLLLAGCLYLWPQLEQQAPGSQAAQAADQVPANKFPRRLLAISIHNYAYASPIMAGSGPKAIDKIVQELGTLLRVPEEQITLLSDRGPNPLPPTRALIEYTVQQYLDSSREQDRVVLLFVGHATELDGKAFLVPLLGETDNEATLIPLSWLFERLKQCKARQKLLILDVFRCDPVRGTERGPVAKMSAAFHAFLNKPPSGVQVICACAAGQCSYEVENNRALDVSGGVFLNQILEMKGDERLSAVPQRPDAEIPVEVLARQLAGSTADKVKVGLKEDQTPRRSGKAARRDLKFDPEAAPPVPLKIELAVEPLFKGGVADRAAIVALLDLAVKVPPIKATDKFDKSSLDALPLYPRAMLAAYETDDKDNRFRKAIVETVDLLVKHKNAFQERFPALPADAPRATAVKNQIQLQQQNLALIYAALDGQYEELKALREDRAAETKYWQANYDYALARLAYRLAQFIEYQVMLGQIRKEELPLLDKQKHTGYRLAAKAKLTDRDGHKLATEGQKLLKRIAEEHKGTPWELLARREMTATLGLEWQPD